MVPDSYLCKDGCWNCVHAFIRREHEESNEWFCHYDCGDRPPCMSEFMNEIVGDSDKSWEAWENWADEHFVEPWGVCDKHEVVDNGSAG